MCVRQKESRIDYVRSRPPADSDELLRRPPPRGLNRGAVTPLLRAVQENLELEDLNDALVAIVVAQEAVINTIRDRLGAVKALLPLNDGRPARAAINGIIDDIAARYRAG